MSIMTAERLERQPIDHELKTWQSYFHAIESGAKCFEIRRDDRDFHVGDTLWLREIEYGSGAYTGREARRTITYILRRESDLGLADGFCILSLAALTPPADGEVVQAIKGLRNRDTAGFEGKCADLLARLSSEVASWRRVSERLENEKLTAERARDEALKGKSEADQNWADQERRANIAQTDLNITQNKLDAAVKALEAMRVEWHAFASRHLLCAVTATIKEPKP